MGFDNVSRKDSKDDLFPVFKSDIEGPEAPLIPALLPSVGVRPVSSLISTMDPISQWRLFSEQLRDRRLTQANLTPASRPTYQVIRPLIDQEFQGSYEQDGLSLSRQGRTLSAQHVPARTTIKKSLIPPRKQLTAPPLENAYEFLPSDIRYFEQKDIPISQVDTGWMKTHSLPDTLEDKRTV